MTRNEWWSFYYGLHLAFCAQRSKLRPFWVVFIIKAADEDIIMNVLKRGLFGVRKHSVEFHVKIAHFTFLTEFSVMMSAPEASADFAIASDTAPMPPSGYPQAPLIPSNSPITWCRRTYPLPGVANQLKVIKLVIRNHKYLMNTMYLWRTSIPPCNIETYRHFSSICLLAIIDWLLIRQHDVVSINKTFSIKNGKNCKFERSF